MDLGLNNSLLAADPRLVDHIVGEVKSQGIFDQFRKECLADVDTKPAYQNLRTRVEGSVNSFLNKQTWRTDLNKNQLRETLRKHIHEAPYLEVGVERIVDQVVNPKIYSVFMPHVEDVVYKYLGMEKPKSQRNGTCDLKDLLPKDLDPVSPESDRNSLKDVSLESADGNNINIANGNETKPTISEEKVQESERRCSTPVRKEENNVEIEENSQAAPNSPTKVLLNSSFKSDEVKTEEEEEDSPVFEPIDMVNLNESNMSNDSHLSGISELTSHRSQSPDFMTEFSRDNFDCSNQDSQLSKVSSNSRLSIVTDFGSSNQASTPIPESKDDTKCAKDNFKAVRDFNSSKDGKFNFEVIKSKDNKVSNFSKENSRDTNDYKESKNKEESSSKLKSSKEKYESRSSRDKDRDSRRRRSSKSDKYSSSKGKDKNESESQESSKYKHTKAKEVEKKEDSSKEVKDLKDLYKEKIRELREKKELTEKERLGKDSKDTTKSKNKKDSSSKEKDDYKKSHKSSSSSSSRSSSYHSNKNSRTSESKDLKDKSSSKGDNRRHSTGKSDSKSSSKSRRDSKSESKSESRSSSRSLKDKKRRDEKKSKSTDDHSSLRKNSSDRRSTDRDGSSGSNSKYSHKSPYGTNNSSKVGPSANLTKDSSKDNHSSSEVSDSVHDSLQLMFEGAENISGLSNYSLENPPKRVDPGSAEICLPLKKRPLHSDESASESETKKVKFDDKKAKKKVTKDIFKMDMDVASVPDEERVQIIEIPDEDYEQPYPEREPILSLEETKKIILDTEPIILPMQSKLSEMEQSIRQSLTEMMSDHKLNETENALASTKLSSSTSTNNLLETLTDESYNDSVLETSDKSINENEKIEVQTNSEQINENKLTSTDDVKLQEELENEVETLKIDSTECNEKSKENIDNDFEMNEMEKDPSKDMEFVVINDSNTLKNEITESTTENLSTLHASPETAKDIEEVDEKVSQLDNINSIEDTINETVKVSKHDSDVHTEVMNAEIDSGISIDKNKQILDDYPKIEDKENVDFVEKHEQDINIDIETKVSDIKEFVKQVKQDVEKIEISSTCSKSIVTCTNDDEESLDTTDEFNEDDKLIIDEEFDEKQSAENDEIKIISEEFVEKNKNTKLIEDNKVEKIGELDSNKKQTILLEPRHITKTNLRSAAVTDRDCSEKLYKPNEGAGDIDNGDDIDNYDHGRDDEKQVESVKDIVQNQIKERLIDELGKLNENSSDSEEAEYLDKKNVNKMMEKNLSPARSNKNIKETIKANSKDEDYSIKEIEVKEKFYNIKNKNIEIDSKYDEKQIIELDDNSNDTDKMITSPVEYEAQVQEDKSQDVVEIQEKKAQEEIEAQEKKTQDEYEVQEEKTEDEDEMQEEKIRNEDEVQEEKTEDEDEMQEEKIRNEDKMQKEKIRNEDEVQEEKIEDEDEMQEEKIEDEDETQEEKIEDEDETQEEKIEDEDETQEEKIRNEDEVQEAKIEDEDETQEEKIRNEDEVQEKKIQDEDKVQEEKTLDEHEVSQEKRQDELQEKDFRESTTTSKETVNELMEQNRTTVVVSPIEEECYYLESDNNKYLAFKKFLEKLEADPSRSLEDMIESFGGVVVPAVSSTSLVTPPQHTQKESSSSPSSDIIETNPDNNNDKPGNDISVETNEDVIDVIAAKRRKVGRMKKSSSTSAIVNLTHQQHPQQQHQQLHHQAQAVIVNGENFVMPLSPDSDVSATSDKNPGNLKDDKRSHRSSQRYSSDDLYKPRPLFSSSSRRNRRFHPA